MSHSSVSAFPAAWRTLANLAQAALPKFLLNRRWYPAKDSESHTATLSTLIPFPVPEGEAAIALWQVRPGRQPPLTLFVPLALVPADAADPAYVIADADGHKLVEAFSVDAFVRACEGEPMRPLTERRARHAALRDVAGMLRSLAYAEAAASGDVTDPARRQRLSAWGEHAASVFLDAYMAAAEGSPGCPPSRPDAERIVRFFMLEKALYEVVYELANRPTWVSIPLAGVLGLLDADTAGRRRAHRMPFGAERRADGTVRFRLWATPHPQVSVLIDGGASMPMQAVGDGWHELVTDRAHVGSRYQFVLPDGLRVHDPASRFQPEDVHGPSEVIDPTAYIWGDMAWKGRRWEEAVVYELHIGAFTPEGTFRSAIGKLDHLVCLGVTAIEIMPIGDFPGRRGWGYDGVLPYTPDGAYGRPEDLKALIEAAHIRGIMVLLDVVYNHFGPDGAYV